MSDNKKILYIRNVGEDLMQVIEDVMDKNRINTKNSAVRHMIENYPLALKTIDKLKRDIQELKDQSFELKEELEEYQDLGKRVKKLIGKL